MKSKYKIGDYVLSKLPKKEDARGIGINTKMREREASQSSRGFRIIKISYVGETLVYNLEPYNNSVYVYPEDWLISARIISSGGNV